MTTPADGRGFYFRPGLRQVWVLCCAILVLGCSQAASATTLTVITSSGVAGTPLAQTAASHVQTHQAGDVVAYAYVPTQGFSGVTVVLDGQIVADSGVIAMSGDHWLFAYGQSATGTSMDNMITVPSDMAKAIYPQLYQSRAPSAAKVDDAYCALTQETVSFPASYLGVFPLPAIAGGPLPANVKRGAGLKDVWQYIRNRASQNTGCGGDLHTALFNTLTRLKSLGIDHINIYRDTDIQDINAPVITINPAGSWSISADEAKFIADTARAFGFTVREFRQIVTNDSKGQVIPAAPTAEFLTRFFDAYIPFVVARAREAEANGIEAFQLDFAIFHLQTTTPHAALVAERMVEAARQVRAVYSGKLMYGQFAPYASNDPALLASIDWIIGSTFQAARLTEAQDAAATVPLLKQRYRDSIAFLATSYGSARKPVVWQLFAQSQRNFLKSGWVEDGNSPANLANELLQVADFSVQAMAYEAQLEAIAEQTDFETAGVDTTGYWYTDTILPQTAFPNFSQSVRNKPAESIVRAWFAGGASAPNPLVNEGTLFTSKQTAAESYLRLYNAGDRSGTVTVTLRSGANGLPLALWTSPAIPAGASKQFAVSEMEALAGGITPPNYFTIGVQSTMPGAMQHVLFRPVDGTLTNLSTCETGVTANPSQLINVHSSLLMSLGFPSTVVVTNTGAAAKAVTLSLTDAGTGAALGTYTSGIVP
ncbi:MAG: hypothetical protein ACYCZX_19145, partial [Rhodospirillaceae bacterium]